MHSAKLVIVLSFILLSCGSNQSDPTEVALNYLNARNKMDYKTAKNFADPITDSTLDQLANFSRMVDSGVNALIATATVEVTDPSQIAGDTATVQVVNNIGGKKNPETVLLIKSSDKKWYVHDNPYEYAPEIVTAVEEEDSSAVESTVELGKEDSIQHK